MTGSPGLRLAKSADGGIDVLDAAGKPVMRLPAPVVSDSSGKPAGTSTTAVAFTLTGTTVAVTVDKGWLTDPARVFPVFVDPSDLWMNASTQTTLSAANPTTSYAAGPGLRAGLDGAGRPLRALGFFDVAQALSGPRVDLNDIWMTADCATPTTPGPLPIGVYQVTQPWTGAATWNTYDGIHPWASPGGDIATTNAGGQSPDGAYSTATADSSTTQLRWSVTALVHGWYEGTIANNGLLLKQPAPETTAGSVSWPMNGSACATASGTTWFYIDVEYTGRMGDRPFYSYETRPLTDTSTLKVNVGTGNLLITNNDLRIAGPGMAEQVQRFYNSLSDQPWYGTAFSPLHPTRPQQPRTQPLRLRRQQPHQLHRPNGGVFPFDSDWSHRWANRTSCS